MTNVIIKNDSLSFDEISGNIEDYLRSLSNYEEIKDLVPASNISLIKNLMAGYASYVSYKNLVDREETYLSTARLPSSVYQIATTFGYSINRSGCPRIKIRYMGLETRTLVSGTVLGSYKELDVVYFGDNKVIEKLDTIEVSIGKYQELTTISEFVDDAFILELNPLELTAVSRDNLRLLVNDVPHKISKDIEDYIIYRDIVDYSVSPYACKLFISDYSNSYGIPLESGETIRVQWLETDGRDLDLNISQVEIDSDYLVSELSTQGTAGDSLDKIKRLAPLFFSTMRRMVTARDHKFVSEAHPLIYSASAFKDPGTPLRLMVDPTADPVGEFTFQLMGVSHTIPAEPLRNKPSLVLQIYSEIVTKNPYVFVESNESTLIITGKSSSGSNQGYVFNPVDYNTTVLKEHIKPGCCTVIVNYVHSKTTDNPVSLTKFEAGQMMTHYERYKMVGVSIIMTPAKVNHQSFYIKLSLTDPKYLEQIKERILDILSKYEFTLNTNFDYGTVLVKISKLTLNSNSDGSVTPVISVVPNQTIFNIQGSDDSYLKFNDVNVILE